MTTSVDYSKYFKNYNFINDFCFNKDDYISEMLLKNYQTSIYNVDLTNKEEVKMLKKIDNIMKIYIVDQNFFQFINCNLDNMEDNYIQDINTILINEYEKFKKTMVKAVETSRWI